MKAPFLAAAAVLLGSVASPAEQPALAFGRGVLSLSDLPPTLADPTVARHLDTGLTTVFLFTVEFRGAEVQKGAVQVEIRYDLWDEVYRVERLEGPAEVTATAVRSRDRLQEWWRSVVLRVAPAEGVWRSTPTQAKVALQVLPFSQAEQRDAQDWLLRSLRGTAAAPERGASAPGQPAQRSAATPVRDFYGAMLASSIGRRSLISYSWTVPVVVESR